jgi:hypothetical protein
MPGDPPIVPLTPADGAVLPVNADGIPMTFTCPVYFKIDDGVFRFPGAVTDYAVLVATAPDVGPDGRLAAANVVSIAPGSRAAGAPEGECVAAFGAGGSVRPQETPGTYYWQVSRLCTTCSLPYETGPVRTLTLRADATLKLKAPVGRAFAGYPVIVPLTLTGLPNGTEARVERKVGAAWRRVGTATALGAAGEAVVTLPAGTQTLRVVATVGADTVESPTRAVVVRAAKGWKTDADDAGRYAGTGTGNRSVTLKVSANGRQVRDFSAFVAMTCPGIDPGTFTTQIGTAKIASVRLDPDGRFVAAAVRTGSVIRIRGKVGGGRVLAGRAELSLGTCTGSSAFTAKRAS